MNVTYREAIRQTLREEMRQNAEVVLFGEDIGAYGGSYAVTKGFLEEFGPERVIDAPIVESGLVGLGVGAAMAGMRPVIEVMTINFALLAIDQIINSAAKIRFMFGGQFSAPLVIRTVAGWGQLGPTHSQALESFFAHVPGLVTVMPATPADARGLLQTALRGEDPVLFIEHGLLYGSKGEIEDDRPVPFGVSNLLREGRDLTVVSYSRTVMLAMQAAEHLAQEGIELEIVDLRSLRPLDLEPAIRSIQKTNRALVVSEAWPHCDLSAEVIARLQQRAFDYLDAPIARYTSEDVPIAYAKELERATFPTVEGLIQAAKSLF